MSSSGWYSFLVYDFKSLSEMFKNLSRNLMYYVIGPQFPLNSFFGTLKSLRHLLNSFFLATKDKIKLS